MFPLRFTVVSSCVYARVRVKMVHMRAAESIIWLSARSHFFGLFGFDFLPPLIPFLWKFHFSLWQLRQRSFKIGFNLKREEKNQFHLIFINYRRKTVIDARMKFIKRFVDSRTNSNSNSSNWTTNGVSSCNRDFRISEMATAIKIKLFHSMEMYWLGMAVESRCIIPNCR